MDTDMASSDLLAHPDGVERTASAPLPFASQAVTGAGATPSPAPPADPQPDPLQVVECARRTERALDALWEVRKRLRRTPAAAVERLAAVDLERVDPRVVEQLYGKWLRQCARLRLPRAYKYHAAFGRGAVLVPEPAPGSRRLQVVSSIGLPDWPPGTLIPHSALPGLKRLR